LENEGRKIKDGTRFDAKVEDVDLSHSNFIDTVGNQASTAVFEFAENTTDST